MKYLLTTLGICLLSLMTLTISAAEEKKAEPQCPVSGKAISQDHSVSYKGAEVYFCCPKCPKAFEMDTKKYAVKSNHQLVQTDQAKQVKCPITGRPDREDKAVTVNGVEVNFCCGNCLKAANEAEDKVVMLFNDKAFEKGFKVTE